MILSLCSNDKNQFSDNWRLKCDNFVKNEKFWWWQFFTWIRIDGIDFALLALRYTHYHCCALCFFLFFFFSLLFQTLVHWACLQSRLINYRCIITLGRDTTNFCTLDTLGIQVRPISYLNHLSLTFHFNLWWGRYLNYDNPPNLVVESGYEPRP